MSSAEAPSAAVRTMTPPFFGAMLLEDRLQAVALVVLEAPRDAEALAVRDVDDEAAGQRDLGREPRALRLHRVLDRLDEDLLAALDQILDLARALAALELGADDLVDVEEAVLLEADLDERGLHAGQHVVDDAEVDVAGDRAALRAARGRPRRPCRPRAPRRASRPRRPRRGARASPSAAARAWAVCAGGDWGGALLALAAPSSLPPSRRPARRRGGRARGGRGRLLAVAPTARAAAALRRRGVGGALCSVGAGLGGRRVDGRYFSYCGSAAARSGRAVSSDFLRRNQGSGKRSLLNGCALAQPSAGRASQWDWEKPWHRPHPRVSATVCRSSGGFGERAELGAAGADRPQALREPRPGPRLDLDVAVRRLARGSPPGTRTTRRPPRSAAARALPGVRSVPCGVTSSR